ncbi:MAG: segregation and condensation protein A [Christensenellales bacterium]
MNDARQYTVQLKDFEGPIDLLLHLIEKAKIDIKDIFVSQITEQYLAFLDEIQELDLEKASEFLTVASTLLLIKSRSLLPKPQSIEEGDPEALLIQQIEEYRLFKEASEKLREYEETARHAYYKLPEEYAFPPPLIELESASLQELSQAFFTVLNRSTESDPTEQQETVVREIKQDLITVQSKVRHIKRLLSKNARMEFRELFVYQPTKIEVVCTFAALLEMLSKRSISVTQRNTFGKIMIATLAS